MTSHLTSIKTQHHSVIVVGGGQAGLSASYYLQQEGVDHLVLEKHSVTHTWRNQRWDAFSLVTPNWQCALPGYTYVDDFKGADPHGFMKKDEINAYLAGFVKAVNAPVREGVTVQRVVPRAIGGFEVHTSQGEFSADQVIVASGGYHTPIIPRLAERLPAGVHQLHSEQYRNPAALPAGNVLVVGSGQSGAQIAEDLHLAGRKVFLAVGDAPRCARFYRGKDVVDWLAEMGYYEIGVDTHPLREGVRDNTNHYVTGRDGGRDIDLRKFAVEGMELLGRLEGLQGTRMQFALNLAESLDSADAVYNRINGSIDNYIEQHGIEAPAGERYVPNWTPEQERSEVDLVAAGITSIIWCIGFSPDFTWVEAPVFNGRGHPGHQRGVTAQPGLYFLGLPWLYTWGSGRFSGVAKDARYLVDQISSDRAESLIQGKRAAAR
ncbi:MULTISPECIES: MSMEG_0569 family flavin-dependent oxidoreductase [Pseudomonas]|jgi:putative flavoprotein involved in K+ transport|uniref:Putative flavoprotein involved in K+ transport n=1 Tax=Pseudomonas moorei TaxID=395599 RepID=A0A1H1EX72_9PSED|nr:MULTISPECIES: MSMEG_0569 family flavin-dependent oxidoreductase [Pseudomonas]KAB0509979.1 MSMEG_0569 family flavin-dependent oxidoreductase [Pseudomonas moorei]SDQ93312.1 putative flavoprotein involved in K+ transport [Pseudomonas moorei]